MTFNSMLEFLNKIINGFYESNFIYGAIFFIFLYQFIVLFWARNVNWKLKTLHYKGKQRVHEGETPRLGGLICFLYLFIFSLILREKIFADNLQVILACLLPMMLVTLKEDLTHDVDYKIRFLGTILSATALIIFANQSLPHVNHIIVISDLFQSPVFSFVFYSLCLMAVANGCNFIDGMNGLLGFYLLGALLSCLQLTYIVDDVFMAIPIILLIEMIILFLLVNFPWGKIFMGDSGAYLMALILGIWVINFFGTYNNISSWNACLIFFYPIAEVTYSTIRKFLQKKSPFHPDREHLHLKVYDILNTTLKKPRLSNNLTTVFLAIFWLAPPLILPWVLDSQIMIFFSICLMSFVYLALNLLIPNKNEYDPFLEKTKKNL